MEVMGIGVMGRSRVMGSSGVGEEKRRPAASRRGHGIGREGLLPAAEGAAEGGKAYCQPPPRAR